MIVGRFDSQISPLNLFLIRNGISPDKWPLLEDFAWDPSKGIRFASGQAIKVPTRMTPRLGSYPQERGMHMLSAKETEDKIFASTESSYLGHTSSRTELANGSVQLNYHIPKNFLQSAMRASPRTPAAYWSYNLYRGPLNARVKLHYCTSKRSMESVCQHFVGQPVLGFDMEWDNLGRNGLKNKVSLIQLASEDRIALFHIARFKDDDISAASLPTFKAIMESRDTIKTGVSILGDCTRLRNNIGIDAHGLMELSHLHNLVKFSATRPEKVSKRATALAVQVEEHLQLPLHKGEVRSSDWTQRLNPEQMMYAASDAYAGFHLYHVLETKRLNLQPVPPRPAHADLGLPIKLAEIRGINEREKSVEGVVTVEKSNKPADDLTSLESTVVTEGLEPRENSLSSDCLSTEPEDGQASMVSNERASRRATSLTSVPVSGRPEIVEAEAWIKQWQATRPPNTAPRTSATILRVYALWHAQSLEVSQIASMLRDPPLQLSTVSCYVLECLKAEKLPFDKSRVQDVIKLIPRFLVQGKYKYFIQRAGLTYGAIK